MSGYWRRNYYSRRRRRLGNSSMWHRGLSVTHNPTYNQKKGMIMMKSPNIQQGNQGVFSNEDYKKQLQYLIDNHFVSSAVYNGKMLNLATNIADFFGVNDPGPYFFTHDRFNEYIRAYVSQNEPEMYFDDHHDYQFVIMSLFIGLEPGKNCKFDGTVYWNNEVSSDQTIMLFNGVTEFSNATSTYVYCPLYANFKYGPTSKIEVHQGSAVREDGQLSVNTAEHSVDQTIVQNYLNAYGGIIPLIDTRGPYFGNYRSQRISFSFQGVSYGYDLENCYLELHVLALPFDPTGL